MRLVSSRMGIDGRPTDTGCWFHVFRWVVSFVGSVGSGRSRSRSMARSAVGEFTPSDWLVVDDSGGSRSTGAPSDWLGWR